MRREICLLLCTLLLGFTVSCSQSSSDQPASSTGENKPAATNATGPTPVQPALGELAITLPKGWMVVDTATIKGKDKEEYIFTRAIDQKLWAKPGPLGTGNLARMSMTVTLRDAKAKRDDLIPDKFGNALVKQKVFTQLIKAEELKIANLTASAVLGDTVDRGRTAIVMLPHNGYLYKWTMDGSRAEDLPTEDDFKLMLASAQMKK